MRRVAKNRSALMLPTVGPRRLIRIKHFSELLFTGCLDKNNNDIYEAVL
ncbi:hypothetical protein C8R31_105169 [Nitrosospira sp. Nsp2]|nr:hypothetical protein C8R31_105169 [Nitrosospira sp. Nsp2]